MCEFERNATLHSRRPSYPHSIRQKSIEIGSEGRLGCGSHVENLFLSLNHIGPASHSLGATSATRSRMNSTALPRGPIQNPLDFPAQKVRRQLKEPVQKSAENESKKVHAVDGAPSLGE